MNDRIQRKIYVASAYNSDIEWERQNSCAQCIHITRLDITELKIYVFTSSSVIFTVQCFCIANLVFAQTSKNLTPASMLKTCSCINCSRILYLPEFLLHEKNNKQGTVEVECILKHYEIGKILWMLDYIME